VILVPVGIDGRLKNMVSVAGNWAPAATARLEATQLRWSGHQAQVWDPVTPVNLT
jgi:hypothetical protein